MKQFKFFFAFALGCLITVAITRIAVRVSAQGGSEGGLIHVCAGQDGVLRMIAPTATCPNGQRSLILKRADSDVDEDKPKEEKKTESIDKSKFDDLDRRLKKLESSDCAALGKSRVVAPFEVVNRQGKRIFYVNDGIAELYNSSGKSVAWLSASASGGNLVAQSTAADLTTTLGASGQSSGMVITESGKKRVELGRRPDKGTYRLLFYSSGGSNVAGIGQSEAGSGLTTVGDTNGEKARMLVTDGKGRINVSQTSDSNSIVELTEGAHGGGKLFICSPSGCDPPMVEAGDAGGYGIVRAGPMGFNPGVGLLGLPGSFIMGKKQ